MPAYRNDNSEKVTLRGVGIEPNETKTMLVFVDDLPSGVVKTSDNPYYEPIILSDKYTSDITIDIPTDLEDFLVDIYVESGEIELRFSSSLAVPLKLGASMSWSRKFFNKIINDIRIKFTTGGKVWVSLERA